MEIDLKKPLLILVILIAAFVYLKSHYTPEDVMTHSHNHPDYSWGPVADYYIGMGYYARSDYEPASNAFNQLLTDYPTSQYAQAGLLRLGESYEELNKWDGAKEAYEKYLKQFPDGDYNRLIQKKYDALKNR